MACELFRLFSLHGSQDSVLAVEEVGAECVERVEMVGDGCG